MNSCLLTKGCNIVIAMTFALSWPMLASCEIPKIGIVLPLSGKAAVPGETVRNSILMANDDLGNPFELVFEDNALDNTRTVASVKKLIETDKIQSLIIYASGPSNAAAAIAEQAKIPMIGLSVDPNVSRSRQWVMIHWASNENVADQLISELNNRKLKQIAIVTTQVQGNLDLEKVFLDKAKYSGIEIVMNEQVLPTETDFDTIILKFRRQNPEAIFLILYYGQAGVFARKCVSQNFHPQFFGHFVLDDDAEITSSQGALNGAFFANTAVGDLSFDESYMKRFGKRPALGGISAYDVISIFEHAFRKKPAILEEVNHYIHTLRDFSGKIGVYSALASNSFDVPAQIGTIIDGRVVKSG